MEADDGEDSARLERGKRFRERAAQLAQFVVDGDAQALERAGRGMDFFARSSSRRFFDKRSERCRGGERSRAARVENRLYDAFPARLFAEIPDGFDQAFPRGRFEKFRRVFAGARVHAHVGVRVFAEGKAARVVVELERRNADVHQHAVEGRAGNLVETREGNRVKMKALAEILFHRLRPRDRRGIAVERGKLGVPAGALENRARVPAAAERAVQIVPAGAGRECVQRLFEQNGNVLLRIHFARLVNNLCVV